MRMLALLVPVLFLLCVSPTFASGVSVATIKGYVNNVRDTDIDSSGGDFSVVRNDVLNLVVNVQNDFNHSVEVRVTGVMIGIDNGDDLEKIQGWYTLSGTTARSKTLSFTIPTTALTDTYDLDLKMEYRYNGTTYTVMTQTYGVEVQDTNAHANGVIQPTMSDVLSNFSAVTRSYLALTHTCFGYIEQAQNCTEDLVLAKEDRGMFKQRYLDANLSLLTCRVEKEKASSDGAELRAGKDTLESQMRAMLTQDQCGNQTSSAVNAVRKDDTAKSNQLMIVVAVAAGGFYWYTNRKKGKQSVGDSYYLDRR